MRIVLDTNIYIAIALKSEFTEKILIAAAEGSVTIIVSEEILNELQAKLQNKFNQNILSSRKI